MNKYILIFLITVVVVGGFLFVKNKNFFKNVPVNTEILGNKEDLISFSILPGSKVHGVMSYRGTVKGGYFFEANILVGITDANKNMILQSNAHATSDWMTADPVNFEGYIDFSIIPKGPAYLEIHNDNASALPENDKKILIPVIVE
jgi:hypothetical protein